MNPGTLDRLRTEVLPGVRGARTLLYDVQLLVPGPVAVGARFVSLQELHRRIMGIEEDLAGLIDSVRDERNAKVEQNMRRAVTARQAEVLRIIVTHRQTHDCAPTMRELGILLGIGSLNGVNDHLRALERKGLIRRTAKLARTVQLTDAGRKALSP